jgi:hypothetical protein
MFGHCETVGWAKRSVPTIHRDEVRLKKWWARRQGRLCPPYGLRAPPRPGHANMDSVMRGLDPRIHPLRKSLSGRWIRGSSPRMTKLQRVGWVEHSETHLPVRGKAMGFANAQPILRTAADYKIVFIDTLERNS